MDEKRVKPEGIRSWYGRTIAKSKRALIIATAVSTVVMALMWILAPVNVITKLQTFNGALVIPLYGGLWIAAFIFMFLVPSREASFRAQESLDEIREEVLGAVKLWREIGLEVKRDLPGLISELKGIAAQARTTITTVDELARKNEKFVEEVRPAVEALKRIEDRIEHEMKDGIVEDFRDMTKAVKMMGGLPVPSTKQKSSEPDLGKALSNITKKKDNVPV